MTTHDDASTDELDIKTLTAERDALAEELWAAKERIVELEETVKQESPEGLKELAGRAQADLQNAKERLEREAGEMRKFAVEAFLLKLLPTIDNLQRAFAHLPEELTDHEWVKGVAAVEKDLMKELESVGLTKIESVGEVVNPDRHEVLQTGPGEKDVVTEVFEEGYLLHDKILRPAKVKVGDGS